jgi:CzcA family heavy metal efflux pump
MKWLVATALQLRFMVVALALLLVVVGGSTVRNLPLDVFPEFARPLVEIQTEVPGLAAEEVEALVSVPLESALNGAPWLTTIRSKSVLGLSSIKLYFESGTDLMRARQLVQERVAIASNTLTAAARPPVILSPLSSTSRVMKIGVQSDKVTQMDLTTLALWTLRPRLLAVPGVANVAVWGQRERQIQVQVSPERLHAHGITVEQVVNTARSATVVAGGGFVEGPNQRFSVVHAPAVLTAADLSQVVIGSSSGLSLRLGDVADVVEASPPPIGDAIINDVPGLLLIVEKQPWGNTLEVTRRVEAAIADLQPALTGIAIDPTIFRPATYIENAVANLNIALLIGCLLVIVVLALFLYEWRTALISITAIPLSLIAAGLIIGYRGGTVDTMVLAGLIVALGEVVDDAIIDVENIIRRLRLNQAQGSPASAFSVVLNASLEVRSAVVFGSMIVVLVLLPVLWLPGLSGAFFTPLALAYMTAILASLAVALVVTPALSLLLLPRAAAGRPKDSPLVQWLKPRYEALLNRMLHQPRRLALILAGAVLCAGVTYPFLGRELLPQFREYDFLMHWLERPGTSLEAMDRVTMRVSKELRGVSGVRNFGSHVGRAEVADEVVGVDFTELWISVDPTVDYDDTVSRVNEVVNGYPGLFRDLLTYLRERIKEVLTGSSGAIVVRLFGPDFDRLSIKAAEVADALRGVEGVANLSVQKQNLVPRIGISFHPESGALFGLTPGDVRAATEVFLSGTTVGEVYDEQRVVKVVVRGANANATSIDALRDLMLATPGGGLVPLRDVADVYISPARSAITREAGSRRLDVTLNPSGRALSSVAEDVNSALAKIKFEQGYYPQVLGEYVELQASQQRLLQAALASVLGVLLLLHAVFGSLRIGLIVYAALPAALVGGVIGAVAGGGMLSLGSWIGFITVLGISARNGIMLVSHCRHLEREEGMSFGVELVRRAATERLTPILMTTLTTCMALLPILVNGDRPGHEIEHPMAVVIVGGLLASALVNLLLVPAFYLRWAGAPIRA